MEEEKGGSPMVKRFFLLTALLILLLPLHVDAANVSAQELVTQSEGFPKIGSLFDGNTTSGPGAKDDASITLSHPQGFRWVYLIFDTEYGEFTITDEETGESREVGKENFLHSLVDLYALFGYCPETITLLFDNGPAPLLELCLFTEGSLPDWVQQWQPPVENGADLVLFSTHADDEQLFFAGVLPYYAGQLGYRVQVVYLTNHRNLSKNPNLRCHEALDGLWAVGVRNYPVFGAFGDYFSRRKEDALSLLQYQGVTEEELLDYVVTQIRRFRPLVAVGHDLNGEYRHGAHMLYADLLIRCAELAAKEEEFPDSVAQYGTWQIPKIYLHLYEENPITMDWDQPLSRFDGMTAFQVTKERGFRCHASQTNDFAWYMSGVDRAADIQKYPPYAYGLWSSTVGPDGKKNDFFENLTTYAQQEAEAQAEEAARLEEQRLREEAERLEQEAEEARKNTQTEPTVPTAEDSPAPPIALPRILIVIPVLLVLLSLMLLFRKRQ